MYRDSSWRKVQMRLDSVRSLKQDLRERTLTRVQVTREMLRDEVAVQRSALPAKEPPPPIALGIEGSHGDYRLAIRIQTASPGVQENIDEILARAHGEASVRVVGRVVRQQLPWHRIVQRPLLIGCSIGHPGITAGTLGCFVQIADGTTCILSNNHVLANENQESGGALEVRAAESRRESHRCRGGNSSGRYGSRL
jgi:hypothetical protein